MENDAEKQQEIKQEMAQRFQPDSFEIESGSAAKGIKVSLKCYFDASEISEIGQSDGKADIKIKRLLKIKGYLQGLGLM